MANQQSKLKVLDQVTGKDFVIYNGDSCEVIKGLPSNSVDLTITSPPFCNLYTYSPSLRDMGNTENDDHFFRHFEYLIPELLRITTPGRLCVIHCKDLPLYMGSDGAAGLRDFPGDITRAFVSLGWTFHSRVTIWKCPKTEMERTNNHGLLHSQLCKDSSVSRQGMADYLLVFRKWSDGMSGLNSAKPVNRTQQGQYRFDAVPYVGTEPPLSNPASDPRGHSIEVWRKYASPVWFDINQTRVLNTKAAKEGDEPHICPLQLDVIDRCIELWSNPSDLVFDPFNGIGSTGYRALQMGRKYVGIELKKQYFDVSARNLTEAESSAQSTLLSLLDPLVVA